MRENTDQNNSEYGQFSRSDCVDCVNALQAHQYLYKVWKNS